MGANQIKNGSNLFMKSILGRRTSLCPVSQSFLPTRTSRLEIMLEVRQEKTSFC